MRGISCAAALVVAGATVAVVAGAGQTPARAPFVGVLDEHPAIQYAQRPPRDRVSSLSLAMERGTRSLAFHDQGGYLRAVLKELNVPADSQLLVFSKTGIQRAATGPWSPRALYFDDSVVVGYVPGARFLELAAHDPEQGVVFYTIDQTVRTKPAVTRRTECLSCHVSGSTLEVPGMIVRSNFVDADGGLLPLSGSHIVNHRTPLQNRWGGWFVTGTYPTPPYAGIGHMGNVTIAVHPASGPVTTSNEIFIEWLNSAPEARGYPSSDSDIAALMLFDHQMHAINLLTRLNWEARVAVAEAHPAAAERTVRELVDEVTDYLLFVGEAPPPGQVVPRPGFAQWFTAAGPRDRQGRSLSDLDLHKRLLRYPCSYMVYTAAFDSLPREVRDAVYRRMWTILSGQDSRPKYSHLSAADRLAIIQILRETKHDLPAVFR